MKKEKTLSEKRIEYPTNFLRGFVYYEEDVKQFIKEILDEIDKKDYHDIPELTINISDVKQIIKEKAGKELIEND